MVSAPTGSGKTVLFELGILNLLSRSLTPDGTFAHRNGHLKTVYLAPTKSLVQEKVKEWKSRFGAIGLHVHELTADTTDTEVDMDTVDIIVATPERFDAVTRARAGSKAFFNEVGLLAIDEACPRSSPFRGS